MRFLRIFPDGFNSAGYAADERDYKVAAKGGLDRSVPVAEAVTGAGFAEAVLSAANATNLLAPFEKMRLRAVLRGPAADPFIRALPDLRSAK